MYNKVEAAMPQLTYPIMHATTERHSIDYMQSEVANVHCVWYPIAKCMGSIMWLLLLLG